MTIGVKVDVETLKVDNLISDHASDQPAETACRSHAERLMDVVVRRHLDRFSKHFGGYPSRVLASVKYRRVRDTTLTG